MDNANVNRKYPLTIILVWRQSTKAFYCVSFVFTLPISSGVATGAQGGRVPPLTVKILPKIGKKRAKIKKNREKRGKIGKKKQKSGRFFHFTPPGGTDLERGVGMCGPEDPPFHASPAARKGPISSKRVSSQDPLLRKFGNFSLYSLNFHPNFSSQAPKFGNFQLTSPQISQMSVRKPHTSEIRAAHPYLKKSWVALPPGFAPPDR